MSENTERPHWSPTPPLDEKGVHDAVFGAANTALKLQEERCLPILTGETVAIYRELAAMRRAAMEASWMRGLTVFLLATIAAKLWFFP